MLKLVFDLQQFVVNLGGTLVKKINDVVFLLTLVLTHNFEAICFVSIQILNDFLWHMTWHDFGQMLQMNANLIS